MTAVDLNELDTQETYDIADPTDHQRVRELADVFVGRQATREELVEIATNPGLNLDLRVASKLATSKLNLSASGWIGTVAVVIAMWGEQRRLRPRSAENPTGENSLHVKLDQLDWLFDGTGIDWRIYAVDDGDPDDSASVAAERAESHIKGDNVTVLRLSDAVDATERPAPLAALDDVDDSRKGGAMVYGAHRALSDGADAVVITDADNSVDLGQLGLLVAARAGGADVVIGDRKNSESVLVKAEARWGPGIVVLRHMQRMVGKEIFDRGIRDTQAAFKLYSAAALEPILAAPSTYGFSFDSDWLYAALGAGYKVQSVPFAFIDSFAESASITQGPMTTWESLLKGLVAAARARGAEHDEAMASVVDQYGDAATLERVVENVPPQLADAPADRLGDATVMTPEQVANWIESL